MLDASQDKTGAGTMAGLGRAAMVTAIALVAVYVAMLGFLITLRGDKEWDRLVYLLSGFEAIVFAGAGALFGTTVQRANVTAARTDAADARQVAKEQRDRAQAAEKDAQAGRAIAAAVKAKAETRADGSSRVRGGRPGEGAPETGLTGSDGDLRELAELVRLMMPDI